MLVNRQIKDDTNQGTPRNYVSIPIGSTVAVQCEDGGPWTHGTIEGKSDYNHHDTCAITFASEIQGDWSLEIRSI